MTTFKQPFLIDTHLFMLSSCFFRHSHNYSSYPSNTPITPNASTTSHNPLALSFAHQDPDAHNHSHGLSRRRGNSRHSSHSWARAKHRSRPGTSTRSHWRTPTYQGGRVQWANYQNHYRQCRSSNSCWHSSSTARCVFMTDCVS